MTERTDGEKVLDIFAETAVANVELREARVKATRDSTATYDYVKDILGDRNLTPQDALAIARDAHSSGLHYEMLRIFERKTSRPSLLEVAQIAFGVSAQERVSAVIDGRPLTVRSLRPLDSEPVIAIPNRQVSPEHTPTEVTGEFAYTTLGLSSLVMTAEHPVYEPALDIVPSTEDDDLTVPPALQKISHTVQVFPVRRVSPHTNTFVPQVSIEIPTPDQAV